MFLREKSFSQKKIRGKKAFITYNLTGRRDGTMSGMGQSTKVPRSEKKDFVDDRAKKPKPGEKELNIFRHMRNIFEIIYCNGGAKEPSDAIAEAAYYVAFIKLFPTTMTGITSYAQKIS